MCQQLHTEEKSNQYPIGNPSVRMVPHKQVRKFIWEKIFHLKQLREHSLGRIAYKHFCEFVCLRRVWDFTHSELSLTISLHPNVAILAWVPLLCVITELYTYLHLGSWLSCLLDQPRSSLKRPGIFQVFSVSCIYNWMIHYLTQFAKFNTVSCFKGASDLRLPSVIPLQSTM